MDDSQMKFALDENVSRQKQVCMLGYGSRESVLDRYNGNGYIAGFQAIEYLDRSRARNYAAAVNHPSGRLMAEGPGFSLNRNFHLSKLSGGKAERQIFLKQQGIKAVGIIARDGLHHIVSMALVEREGCDVVDRRLQANC